jgi:hypothetical protein
MLQYVGALHRLDKGSMLQGMETTLRDDWFRPVSLRVPESVDAAPEDVRELIGSTP